MKKCLFLILVIHTVFSAASQTFPMETLVNNGDINKLINIVILGDGYTSSQQDQFKTDAQAITNYLFNTTPFKEYKNYFNVVIIKVPSAQSGAKHPATATDVNEPVIPVSNPNNYFGSTFDYGGIHRLLVPVNNAAVSAVLANNFPQYDQVLMIVNSTEYGGSGGAFATSSINSSAPEIAMHELAHSFAGLADEYWAGDSYAQERANLTKQTNPGLVKWKNWYGLNNIGIYQHGSSGTAAQWYRPHQSCKMRYLGYNYCSVCTETIIEKIHDLTGPINSFSPANNTSITAATGINFNVNTIKPIPNTLEVSWSLNGVQIVNNSESYQLNLANLTQGTNTLVAKVIDKTDLSKADSHPSVHQYLVTWTIQYTPCPDNLILKSPEDDFPPNSGTSVKKATNTVKATNKLSGNTANVIYRSGKNITLEPGFSASNITVFTAEINVNPCN